MAATTSVQYQHFVPQFLLRNFSHSYMPRKHGPKNSKTPRRKSKDGIYPGEQVVHNLNLSVDPPVICETPVKRILGEMDMYRDTSKPSPQQQHIEQMFSKLECQASAVFRQITKAFEQKEKMLWLSRDERDLIRKFLFLLKYRGSGFRRRFYHENADSYDADDRELLHDYMTENGYERPIDVWFHNLKTIIELRMDPEGKWIEDLPNRMFTPDAMWFITHAQCSYMAICTPTNPSDDFILADNSYNVFEGPNYLATDAKTGKVEGLSHTPFHEFAPISPKLIIILRSFVFPVPEEDANVRVKESRSSLRSTVLNMVDVDETNSLLVDLPVRKARNNYSEIIDGRIQLINGEDGNKRKDHKFCFAYFPIETAHVNIINGIFLDNAYSCSTVVFKSKENFARTLEWYLTEPCAVGKRVTGDDGDPRLAGLKRLASVSKSLGSVREPVWRIDPIPVMQNYGEFRQLNIEKMRFFGEGLKSDWKSLPITDHMKFYRDLGGSDETLFKDMEQTGPMWKLRVKIDVWSKGLDESLRQRNRELLTEAYLRLPLHRVWLYLKYIRLATGLHVENKPQILGDVTRHIITPQKIAHLMHDVAMNDVKIKKRLGSSNWADLNRISETMVLKLLISVEPNYVRDCGIIEIEELARKQQLEILKNDLHNQAFESTFFNDGEKIELLTRIMVRPKFMNALKGKLEGPLLKALKSVFFEVAYPTPKQDTKT